MNVNLSIKRIKNEPDLVIIQLLEENGHSLKAEIVEYNNRSEIISKAKSLIDCLNSYIYFA